MQLGHLLHEVQAQASALAAAVGTGQGVEAFGQARQGVVGDGFALVEQTQRHALVLALGGDADAAVGWCEVQGVVQQVGQCLAQQEALAAQAEAGRYCLINLQIEQALPTGIELRGERFLLRQALANLLDNALDFTPPGGRIRIAAERQDERVTLRLFNQGEAIPDYALARLTERFYSLPRPNGGRKSTGLGLNFVQEVAELHGGELQIGNVEGGVEVRLTLPA